MKEKTRRRICGKRRTGFKYFLPLKTEITQPAITCSKLTIETLEQDRKYVQS